MIIENRIIVNYIYLRMKENDMRNRFDRQLLELNNELIEMGSLIEQAIEMGISALVKQNVELADKAIKFDVEIDEQEKNIESLCMKLLLQQQPVARDLRLISAALKMITDMERIGDHAADISEMTILMAGADYSTGEIDFDGKRDNGHGHQECGCVRQQRPRACQMGHQT